MNFMHRHTSLFNELNKFFEEPLEKAEKKLMKTDIREKDGSYMLDIEIPGYNKDEVAVNLYDGYLTVSANHEQDAEERDALGNLVRQERLFGSCSRSFYVGDTIDSDNIKAKYENGVLKITLPKAAVDEIENTQHIMIE